MRKLFFGRYLIGFSINLIGQNTFIISSGNVNVTNGSNIHLKNTKFQNNGAFDAGTGRVVIEGDAVTNLSTIGGSSPTTFYDLTINKSSNDATLGQNISISNQLTFTSGKFEIGNYNLTMGNSASFAGQNQDRYIVTGGTGSLVRQVGNSWTAFPVGNSKFNPARLKNAGVLDNFSIRVADQILQNGTSGSAVTQGVIPRTWFIEEATIGGSNVSMRLIWRPIHQGTGFDAANSQIAHYTGGAWQGQGSAAAATADNSYSSDHKYREATNITSFSPFGIQSNASLPVELLYFYAEKQGKNVRLDWQTATELNNSHFDVEWSTDGISFEKIGEVAGAGTTTEVQLYDFLHENPVNGENYYRLKQVDLPTGQAGFDEKHEYTNIIEITFDIARQMDISIYPNPAAHYLKIESEDLIGEMVQIFSVNGQLVKELQHQSPITNLPITNLPNGTYFVKMGKQVKKLIIQK